MGPSVTKPLPDEFAVGIMLEVAAGGFDEVTVVAVVAVGTPCITTPIPSWLDTLLTTAVTTECAASGGNWASTDFASADEDVVDSERDGVEEYIVKR